jgi:hypothetical protein
MSDRKVIVATTPKTKPTASPKDNRHSIRINDPELYDAIERTAKERGWAISDLYREAIKEYLGRDQLKDDLAEFEKRVAASHRAVTKEQRRMRNDIEVMLALFDVFARSYFLHTPSVPPEAVETAAKDGWQRYEKMRVQIAAMVRAQGGALAIAKELNAELDSDGPPN